MTTAFRARRGLRLAVVVVALSLTAAACGKDKSPNAGSNKPADNTNTVEQGRDLKTVQAGKLTVCSDIPYAPFEYQENGDLKGIDVDLVRAITGRLGLSADFRDTDFDGIFAALKAGQCDIIASSVSITDERKKQNDFSAGYFKIHQSLLVRKGEEAKYKDLPDLKGKTIGVQSGTTGADYAKAHASGAQVKEFTGADELFTALKAGQVDAALQDQPVNAYNAKVTGQSVVANVFDEGAPEEYGFVIPKGKDALKKAIDNALSQVRSDDSYRTILTNYLGSTAGQA
ncbi:MAG: polar amino acid transport system substrate-binding protein [Acidimicrobiaceae bacterium]|nr:polar amino acid transport system substrate-binding protein [Acidimicrobiaceae bacterium]